VIVYGTMQIGAAPSMWTYLGDASYALYLTDTFIVTPLLPLWIKFLIPADAIIAFGVTASGKSALELRASHPIEGRVAIVTDAGLGCGGR
jgi:hypothetical protein